jgi:hypothetical protein
LLKYPDGGFLLLMVFAMSAEGWLIGTFIGPAFTTKFGTFEILPSLAITAVMMTIMIAGAYYMAKAAAWILYRVFHS